MIRIITSKEFFIITRRPSLEGYEKKKKIVRIYYYIINYVFNFRQDDTFAETEQLKQE